MGKISQVQAPPKVFERSTAAIARPSSSIILVSTSNQVLLLQRVPTSTAFPSAHVFPGGNISPEQDGAVPPPEDPSCHLDSRAYRLAALRECFEESGILLARTKASNEMMQLSDEQLSSARIAVHSHGRSFTAWLDELGAVADTENLIPFTRWLTPTNLTPRYTTQMYVYFLPLPSNAVGGGPSWAVSGETPAVSRGNGILIRSHPTSDGGIEHSSARFLSPRTWLKQADAGKILLIPPQYVLLHLLSRYFQSGPEDDIVRDVGCLQRERDAFMTFLDSAQPSWRDKCISPYTLRSLNGDRAIVGLDKPGLELKGSGRMGDSEMALLVRFDKIGGSTVLIVGSRAELLSLEGGPAVSKMQKL
ncbi:MAG: hypothetical protein M1825_002844 [Sarcosagium campestre]|nr:MAG: hypothetical protein M1825_002844 [Sarcosagium campestre]